MMKRSVLLAVVLLVFGFSGAVGAETTNTKTFDQKKAEIITQIDQRIRLLQDERMCVQAATTQDQIKKCHEPTVQQRKEGRAKMLERKQGAGTTSPQ